MPTIAIVGAGATGMRVARQLSRNGDGSKVILVDDAIGTAAGAANSLGDWVEANAAASIPLDASVVVLATRSGTHAPLAQECVSRGQHVVSVCDSIEDVRGLLDLNDHARAHGVRIVVGAGLMPGLSDVLAAHGRSWFDEVREVHVSKFGTGGPDCARQHHAALKGLCFDWRNGGWVRRTGGSGRELAWFPPPVAAADCYRAALADPLLLVRAHPNVDRVTARMAATRRDRLTMHLPMLRRPHPEGLLGAVRVELRGLSKGAQLELVLGCAERPAVAAGAVAATAVSALLESSDEDAGSRGLVEWFDPLATLRQLRMRGLRPEIFGGAGETY
jgi:saccharopine dehydrogenase-like NADP-dependent oxidoreductase